MIDRSPAGVVILERQLAESEATVQALLAGEIDAVVDPRNNSPVLLAMAQKALRDSEERYRGIVETANEGICMMNFDSTITFVNQRLADMLGYAAAGIVGQSMYSFLPLSFHEDAVRLLEGAALGVSEENESALLQRSGREMSVLVKTSCVRDASGSCVGMLAMLTDRTSHLEGERALKKSEAEYRQIVESTTDGIIKVDQNGTIGFVNSRLAEMLGYEPAELVGTRLLSVIAPCERPTANQALTGPEQRMLTTLDTVYRHKSGAEISVNIACSPLQDAHGQSIGVLGVIRDVTERKKLQEQLIVSDRMASVGTLAAGVAHEINNPLSAVIANLEHIDEGMAQLLSGGATYRNVEWIRERIADPLTDAREAAERVRFIVRDLMIFSRSRDVEPKLAVDVNAVLESSLRMGWNEIRHRADLIKNLGDVPLVAGNEARLGQVFLNLIVNAAQSLPVGRLGHHEIRVSTNQSAGMVDIEIADTGSGIAPEAIERIFDAFYTTKAAGVGTGLGLAICQRIVTDMHGTLTVSSTLGVGSTFRVSLPIASETVIETPVASAAGWPRKGGRLLVVDDEEIIARVVQRALGDSYEILSATSAWAALALIENGDTFDVILCDLMMPNMTGMDLHRALLAQAPHQARRMLFMTGGAFTPEARQFLANSGTAHFEKPFNLEKLRGGVHDFLAGLEPSA